MRHHGTLNFWDGGLTCPFFVFILCHGTVNYRIARNGTSAPSSRITSGRDMKAIPGCILIAHQAFPKQYLNIGFDWSFSPLEFLSSLLPESCHLGSHMNHGANMAGFPVPRIHER